MMPYIWGSLHLQKAIFGIFKQQMGWRWTANIFNIFNFFFSFFLSKSGILTSGGGEPRFLLSSEGTLQRKVKHWTTSLNFISYSRANEDMTLGFKYKMIKSTVRHSSEKCNQSQLEFLSRNKSEHFSLTFQQTAHIQSFPPLAQLWSNIP